MYTNGYTKDYDYCMREVRCEKSEKEKSNYLTCINLAECKFSHYDDLEDNITYNFDVCTATF